MGVSRNCAILDPDSSGKAAEEDRRSVRVEVKRPTIAIRAERVATDEYRDVNRLGRV